MRLVTILVEDSPTIRDSLIPALEELSGAHVVAVATTAEEGVALLTDHSAEWRLAVVDLFLASGNGLQVLRSCQDRRPDQHVVVLTNYATAEIRDKAIQAGADAVFDKSTETDRFFELCAAYAAEAP